MFRNEICREWSDNIRRLAVNTSSCISPNAQTLENTSIFLSFACYLSFELLLYIVILQFPYSLPGFVYLKVCGYHFTLHVKLICDTHMMYMNSVPITITSSRRYTLMFSKILRSAKRRTIGNG